MALTCDDHGEKDRTAAQVTTHMRYSGATALMFKHA